MNRLAGILLTLFLASCTRPAAVEQYVRTGDRDAYGRYSFSLDMSDAQSVYDIYVYARMRVTDRGFSEFSSIPVTVLMASPDSILYEGKSLLSRSQLTDSTYYWKAVRYALASDLVPAVCGEWKMYLTMPGDSIRKYGIEGLGISLAIHNKSGRKAP